MKVKEREAPVVEKLLGVKEGQSRTTLIQRRIRKLR